MFFSQDILQKRGGKFGIVWIAATRPVDLTRRDYYNVNVHRTCEDIIRYIDLRGSPVKRGGARPRLSLYLSSQLMYGVVRVYHKQQHYLLCDSAALRSRFRSIVSTHEIDSKPAIRMEVTGPDIPMQSAPRGPYFDPEFGRFIEDDQVLLPDDIPDIDTWKIRSRDSTLEGSDISLPPSPKVHPLPFADLGSPMQADRSRITMLDLPISPIVPVEQIHLPGERDLPPFEAEEIVPPRDEERDAEQHVAADVDKQKQVEPEVPVMSPTGVPTLETTWESDAMDIDRGMLPPMEETPAVMPELTEAPGSPQRRPGGEVLPDVTALSPTVEAEQRRLPKKARLALNLSPVEPSPATRRRKRQLNFADDEMQISKVRLRRNLQTGRETCRQFELAGVQAASVNDLFNKPARKDFCHRKFLPLWKRNCRTSNASETDSEKGVPVWTVPDLRLETSGESEAQVSPIALPLGDSTLSPVLEREEPVIGEPEAHVPKVSVPEGADASNLSVEAARDKSLSLLEKSRRLDISSIHEGFSHDRVSGEASGIGRSREASYSLGADLLESPQLQPREHEVSAAEISVMEDLLEVSEEREIVSPRMRSPSPTVDVSKMSKEQQQLRSPAHRQLLRTVSTQTAKAEWTTFEQICPKNTTTRQKAAKIFSCLLDHLKHKVLVARQDEAYGEIYIGRPRMD